MKFFATKRGRETLNVIFSIGASIVIFGALAKIEHWGGILGHALEAGMITETFVFLLMAFIPPEREYYWERFFPNITESPEEEMERTGKVEITPIAIGGGHPVLGQMDRMMQEANITPQVLQKLSEQFQRLGTTVSQLADVSQVIHATQDYGSRLQEASEALLAMRQAYADAASAASYFTQASEATRNFHEQIQTMTKNLSSLNAIYELELQDTNHHLKVMNQFYTQLANASRNLESSLDDTRNTQEQIALLAKNLSQLNKVYGNMLSALQVKA
ncbi:MAG: gliding motility protein GldL [Thermoflavifilum sp.]|nr:gliding motility protein GldL [Thermoflavifilum sp.]